jgi:hypothetical protein
MWTGDKSETGARLRRERNYGQVLESRPLVFPDVKAAFHALGHGRTRLDWLSLERFGHTLLDGFIFKVRVNGFPQRPIIVRIVEALLLQDNHDSIQSDPTAIAR